MLKSLEMVGSCLAGASAALPPLGGKLIPLTDSPVRVYPFHFVAAPSYVKGICTLCYLEDIKFDIIS